MSKLRKQLKKINAGILAAAVVISSLHISGAAVEAAEPEFNADDVVLKVGVLSDPHFMYTDDDGYVTERVTRYKNAITYLNNRANDNLDMIMLGGDYTGTGSEVQATAFAKATKEALDSINEGKKKADATKLILAYGNHDTDWGGQMDYAGWENVLNQYGILDSVEKGPEGCYKSTVTNSGKTYHFYSLETYTYNNPTNMFLTEALNWLEKELNTVTKKDPNSYVYVVSHGPIWETGVYGADYEFNRSATWGTAKAGFTGTTTDGRATSSDVNNVLRKYPQVVYFSGHTHRTNILESTIMQKDYTAINVSSVNGGDLFADEPTFFLEGNYDASRPGHVLLVEVDGNGNQKITRINIENNSVCGEPWVMSAPNAEKTHLETYTQAARQKTPVFASDATFSIDNIAYTEGKEQMTFDVSFDAATCDNYVFRYELVLYDQNGKSIDTKWMVGNWTDHKSGVAEGTSHLDATKFKYSLTVDRAVLFGTTGFYATLQAVDEFGGRSKTLTWKSKDSLQSVALMRPTGGVANKNLFDGFTATDIATGTNGTLEFANNGKGSTTFTTTGNNGHIVFALNDEYAASTMTDWGLLGRYAKKLTTLKPSDTFVYEFDFAKVSGSNVYLAFRAPNVSDNQWMSGYSGINMTASGVELWLNYERLATSDAFKLTDTNTHKVKIVSAPKTVSVWIDDVVVFSDQEYGYPEASLDKTNGLKHSFKDLGGTTRSATLNSADLYPAIGIFSQYGGTFTVNNQVLYLYNSEEQVEKATTSFKGNNLFSNFTKDKVATNGEGTNLNFDIKDNGNESTTYTITGQNAQMLFKLNDAYASQVAKQWGMLGWNADKLTTINPKDTFVLEMDFQKQDGGDLYLAFRSPIHNSWESNYTGINLSSSGVTLKLGYYDTGTTSTAFKFTDKASHHIKIVSAPTSVSVWIDDIQVFDNQPYAKGEEVMYPAIGMFTPWGATFTISNPFLYLYQDPNNITPFTEENNLLETHFANISSDIMRVQSGDWLKKPKAIVNGTNFYTDMTKASIEELGLGEAYQRSVENFTFWGISEDNPKIAGNDSFVFSTLAKIYNTTAENSGILSRFRMRLAKYNGVETGFIIDDTTLKIMTNQANPIAEFNLASTIGYAVGDEIRITALVTPFGWDLYIDNCYIYSYEASKDSHADYTGLTLSVQGTKAKFLDTSIHYNNDNGALYKEKILGEVATYAVERKGIWYDDKAWNDAEVARIKALCDGLNTTSNVELKQYVGAIRKIIATGKITNNMVWDGSTTMGEQTNISTDSSQSWCTGAYPIFGSNVTMSKDETWLFEADVKCLTTRNAARVGFTTRSGAAYDIMVQNNEFYRLGDTRVEAGSTTWGAGANWHVQFIVKPGTSIQTIITSVGDANTTIWDKTLSWSEIGLTAIDTEASCYPQFYFGNGDFALSNIYVGYDVTNDVNSLNAAVTSAKQVDTTGKTTASINAFNEAIAEAKAIADVCTDPYTNPYSKVEINAAETAIATAQAALVNPTAELVVGGGDTKVNEVKYGIANGEVLPTGYVKDKYIIGWTLDGATVTNYDASVTDITKYVADFIDTDMLDVAWQQNTKEANSTVYRFIGSVNDTDKYSAVGFEFSLDGNKWYDLGSTTTVYEKIKENNGSKTAAQIYGNEYSEYLFVQPLNFGTYTSVYVRSYVILDDGETVVYGETSLKNVSEYGKN